MDDWDEFEGIETKEQKRKARQRRQDKRIRAALKTRNIDDIIANSEDY